MSILKLTNVNKIIKKRTILSEINLSLTKGNIYGLYGRNGSGKTMLIRTIAGLILPTSGEIEVFGKVLGRDISFPESMGITIENVGFWPKYTGFECLQLIASIKKKANNQQIATALDRVGLDPYDKRRFNQYSLGMKQKLAIAQAIMEQPDLIMLDEPTNSLDEESIKNIRQLLLEETERNALIIIASHNKEDLKVLADKTYQLTDGCIQDYDIGDTNI